MKAKASPSVRLLFPVVCLLLASSTTTPAAAQAVTKRVELCPPPGPIPLPCRVPIRAEPGFTSVLYHVSFTGSGVYKVVDEIPANALGFRVLDTGFGVACDSPGGPFCTLVPAPGGANGTGTIVIENLWLGGPFWTTPNIFYEVDFSCLPTRDRDPIANQAEVYTPTNPAGCNPCLSDDPLTMAAGDPTVVTASCLPPPSFTLRKTASVSEWRLGDDPAIAYQIEIANPSATATMLGSEITVWDYLPISSGGYYAYSPRDTCPIQVTSVPPATLTVNNDFCETLPPQRPYIQVNGLPDIPPLGRVVLDLSLTILGGHPDQYLFCNEAAAYYNVDRGSTNWKDCLTVVVPPQVIDFRGSVKSVSPDVAFPGDPLTYTVAVTNSGTQLATGVYLSDAFGDPMNGACQDDSGFDPAQDVTVRPGPPSGPITYDRARRLLTVPLPDMPPGAVQTVTIEGLVADNTACCNRAWIGASELPDPHPAGAPSGPGDLACYGPREVSFRQSTKSVAPSPMLAGEPVSYTLAITNWGIGTANHVVVTDIFPDCVDAAGFDPATDVAVSPGPASSVTYDPGLRLLTVTFDTMAPLELQTIAVGPLVAGPAAAACCNQAFVYSDEVPPRGDPTGSVAGAGDPTCVPIVAASGCDLRLAAIATGSPRTPPWVYTNGCSAPPRVEGARIRDVVPDTDIDPVASGPGIGLTLYQLDCPCSDVIEVYKNTGVSPAMVRIRF